jgi:hypothetical protein
MGAWAALSCARPQQEPAKNEEPPAAIAATPPEPEAEPVTEPVLPTPPLAPGVRRIGHCDTRQGVLHFTLAHFNDLQARYSSRIGGRSRYGYIAGYLRALKDEVPATLVVDAGDDYEKGSVAELRSMGESTRRMIQALPIDVRTIGNHDFAYGEDAVVRDVTESRHPVLAANIRYAKDTPDKPPLFAPYARFDVGCVRVGVVGMVTGSYGADDKPSRAAFDDVFAQDDHYASIALAQVRAHRDEVDVMISLDHLGLFEDTTLLGRTPGLDLAIGAHTEELLEAPSFVGRGDGSRAWVLEAGHWAQTLGRADFAYDLEKKKLSIERYRIIHVGSALPFAEDVGDLVNEVEAHAAPDAQRAIAVVNKPIERGAPMADLVWRAVRDRWGADALLLGRDVFWGSLASGPVTLQSLFDTVLVQREPSGTSGFTSLWIVWMTGAELNALRGRIQSPMLSLYAPGALDPARVYRVVTEKRALERPGTAFIGPAAGPWPRREPARFGGELIDVLESYARARTASGLTLD